MEPKTRYLIYARISPRGSDYEGETSIPTQIEYCRRFVAARGGVVAGELSDKFASGGDLDRPAMQQILQQLAGTPEWDTLITYNLSRLTRSPRDMYTIMDALNDAKKTYVSATEPDFDFSTLAGEMMIGVISHVNQYMRKQLAKATHDRMMSIAARGEWPAGRAPFGYRRREKKNNVLYPDPVNAKIIRDIFDMYARENCPTMSIARKYYRKISKNQILAILRNPVYIGMIRYGGEEFKGKHEPLIDADTWLKAQAKLPNSEEHERPKARRYPYLLAGRLFCTCGHKLTPASAKSGQYAYYVCGDQVHRHVRVNATKLDEMAVKYIRELEIDQVVLDAVVDELRREEKAERKKRDPELKRLRQELAKREKERKNIVEDVLTDTRFNSSVINLMNERVTELDAEIAAYREDIERLTPAYNQADLYKAAVEFVAGLNKVSQLMQADDDPDTLRLIIQTYIDRVEMREDGSFAVYPNSNIVSSQKTVWQPRLDSNQG